MLKNAMSENAADLMLELYEAVEAGNLRITAAAFARNHHVHHLGRVRPRSHLADDNRAGEFAVRDGRHVSRTGEEALGTETAPATRRGRFAMVFVPTAHPSG